MSKNEPISLQWYQAADRWVDAEGAANLLEETRGSVFSQMTMRQSGSSVAAKELAAKASDEWQKHVEKIAAARKSANKAKVDMDYLKMLYFESQGNAATERVMARMS